MYHFQVQKMTRMQLWMISFFFFRSYENCRRPGVAILDMQMSKVPIISSYDADVEEDTIQNQFLSSMF
jgi:hypothetical protein